MAKVKSFFKTIYVSFTDALQAQRDFETAQWLIRNNSDFRDSSVNELFHAIQSKEPKTLKDIAGVR